jgi:hypothetical protein
MFLSKAHERDFVGNSVPREMIVAEERSEQLSNRTLEEAELWDWQDG